MTTTSKEVPTAPAWFNLSSVVDNATMEEVRAATAEIEAISQSLQPVIVRAFRALTRHAMAVEAANLPADELYELADRLVGADRLNTAARTVGAMFTAIVHEDDFPGETPDWLVATAKILSAEVEVAPYWLAKFAITAADLDEWAKQQATAGA